MTEMSAHWDYARNTDRGAALRMSLVVDKGYDHHWSDFWQTNVVPSLESMPGWTLRASAKSARSGADLLLVRDGALLEIDYGAARMSVVLDAATPELRDEIARDLRERFPEPEAGLEEASVDFWYRSASGPRSFRRVLATPAWDEISGNYMPNVRAELARLLDPAFAPGLGGKLLLWHGRPGTGKTHALRSLIRGWQSWCSVSYVSDIDVLFRDAAYLLEILVQTPSAPLSSRSASRDGGSTERYHLVCLEDAGEFLTADAATRSGQGFSRLLNTTDGLLGQGLPVLLLVTTNEEIDKLHPAVSRPGRCASRIEFGPLDEASANAWLHEHGSSDPASGPMSLAELYALAGGWSSSVETGRRVGFQRS